MLFFLLNLNVSDRISHTLLLPISKKLGFTDDFTANVN
jgi:hypothetical protein